MAVVASASPVCCSGAGRWRGLTWLRPPIVPIPTHVPLDGTVLLVHGGVAHRWWRRCAAWRRRSAPSRSDISRVLQAGFRRASGAGRRTRDVLVVVEMAMSVALVAVSALLIQSLLAVQQVPLGFDPSNVFTLQFRLPQSKYATPEDIARFFRNAIERVRAVPGVAVGGAGPRGAVQRQRRRRPATPSKGSRRPIRRRCRRRGSTSSRPDYFKTMRIPILKGRDFTDRDDLQTPLVAVVNETFAQRAFGPARIRSASASRRRTRRAGHHHRRRRRREALHGDRAGAAAAVRGALPGAADLLVAGRADGGRRR